ncbi:hypothetical protein COT64_01090 [Candidatus Shapirobacteria bacterium CG09_land_8_20_14_0_10_39_12]|uniref:Type 4a pilus biogenesis protein PilO n=1 Tax=Candidatus Shapirobacteria bacterium CG09_land_8_20_14_0_10_39_12 TaxID=1974885 RepID=A0A2H0WPZ9_9BACT|nr:MAG: hypothetical protein COT64_01090 [Candidatus Shapirobacteria bacterium CG09_land_8_20_14_0_10_39_12]
MNTNENKEGSRYFIKLPKIRSTVKTLSFFWLSFTFVVIAFFLIFAIKPTLVTIAKLNKEIEDKTLASTQLQKKIDSIVAAQDVYAKNSSNIYLLNDAFPNKSEFPKIAYFFEQIATDSGVNLTSLNIEKVEEKALPAKEPSSLQNSQLNFSVSVSGDYPNLKGFIAKLESSRRILILENTVFSRTKKEESFELTLFISGRASYEKKF